MERAAPRHTGSPAAGERSRYVLRAMEWDEPKAKYPNVWADGMPRDLLLNARAAERLRLGDLIATYYPSSQRHPERAERIVGISRVAALRRAEQADLVQVTLDTAFRFDPPLAVAPPPRRVFLCCDPGWPDEDVALFREIHAAAVAAGWRPLPAERDEPPATGGGPADTSAAAADASPAHVAPLPAAPGPAAPAPPAAMHAAGATSSGASTVGRPAATPPAAATARSAAAPMPPAPPSRTAPPVTPSARDKPALAIERWFAGVDYSGDMRDPRRGTWLAIVGLAGERLTVLQLTATGRSGLEARLRDPDPLLTRAEAIGLDFPLAVPAAFADSLLDTPAPADGWWAFVRRLERLTRPEFLIRAQEFRAAHGTPRRLADERAGDRSPLDRAGRDLCPMTFHGVRMIGADRSRFAVRPFETAQGRLLFEVRPDALLRALRKGGGKPLERLAALEHLPVDAGPHARTMSERGALAAALAARAAAVAVLAGEADKTPDELAPGDAERVLREGWIYGLEA